MQVCNEAKALDTEGKHTSELDGQIQKCYMAQSGFNAAGKSQEEIMRNAQSDPELQV